MARLPLLDLGKLDGDLGVALQALPVELNIFRVLAHAETCAMPQMRLGGAILSRQALGHRERELLILLVAQLEGGAYEWRQHVQIALGVGVTQAQIDAVEAAAIGAPVFDAAERALLAFGKQVIEDVRVDAATFRAAGQHFSAREIVEAILTIGFYMTMARLTEATETDLDAAVGMTVFNAVQHRQPKSAP